MKQAAREKTNKTAKKATQWLKSKAMRMING